MFDEYRPKDDTRWYDGALEVIAAIVIFATIIFMWVVFR